MIGYDKISPKHFNFLANIEEQQEPNNYLEANKKVVWVQAMEDELKALNHNHMWELVQLPKEKRQLDADGFIGLNTTVVDQSRDIRLV